MTLRQNQLCDSTAEMLQEATNNVRIGPILYLEKNNQQMETYQWKDELISLQEGFGDIDKGHFPM